MFFTFSYQNGNDYNVYKKPRKCGNYVVCAIEKRQQLENV